jgi:NAD(P)H-flavin reductase
MLDALSARLNQNPDLHIVILQGVQTRLDVLYTDTFLAFATQHPRVTFRAYLSREPAETILQPHEYRGYVQHAFPDLALDHTEDIVYLCGNPGMIDNAFAYLSEAGFPSSRLIREKYISAK